VSFDYIVQPAEGEYGTTVPLFLAKNELKGITRFGYFMGDDFTYNRRGFSEFRDATRDMISHPDADHLAMAQRVSREEAIKYGIFYTDKDRILQEVKEKPRPEQVPEHPLANISKYILKNNIWSAVDETMTEPIPEEAKGERQFTRTMSQARLDGQTILIHPLSPGTVYRDGGTLEGLRSTSEYVRTHPRVDPQPLWK
jgi:UTP-glucose-1-phosphate uridylyltransferase